jgi:hypothetical protein
MMSHCLFPWQEKDAGPSSSQVDWDSVMAMAIDGQSPEQKEDRGDEELQSSEIEDSEIEEVSLTVASKLCMRLACS